MSFDGKSFYPSAMLENESCYSGIETGYVFTPDEGKEFNSLTIELLPSSMIKHLLF